MRRLHGEKKKLKSPYRPQECCDWRLLALSRNSLKVSLSLTKL
jgi:hypothetical protein